MKLRVRIALAVSLVFLALAGCADKQEVKHDPDADRADEALQVVRAAFLAYDSGRYADFRKFWVSEENAAQALRFDGDVAHEFSPRMVELEGPRTRISLSWTCTWNSGDRTQTTSGLAVFVLNGSPPRLDSVEGEFPFAPPR